MDAGSQAKLIKKGLPPEPRTVKFLVRAAGGDEARYLDYRNRVAQWCAGPPEVRATINPFMEPAPRVVHPEPVARRPVHKRPPVWIAAGLILLVLVVGITWHPWAARA